MCILNRSRAESGINAFWMIVVLMGISLILSESMGQSGSKSTVIQNVRIFDGERIIPKDTVVFQDGKIVGVGKNVSVPANSEMIDGEGKTLLPGLIDAHVHVWDETNLKQSLIFGVTTVVDMGMDARIMTKLKKKLSSGDANDLAGLISAGSLITAPKGHGTEYGIPFPTITKPEEAQPLVDACIAEGSDFIKVIYDDGSAYSIPWPTLDKATLAAVIQAARERKKLTVVHIGTLRGAREVVEAGADGLAHLFSDDDFDPEFGRLVARHKVFVIPTFSVLESLSGTFDASTVVEDHHLSPFLNQMDIMSLKRPFPVKTGRNCYEAAERALRQLKEEDVRILAGTDAGNPGTMQGASLHRELELLVQAGMTPLEALTAATSTTAEIFNINDCGRIKPKMAADLVLVNGNPAEDICVTRDIAGVWKNGVKVDRDGYRAVVQREREAAKQKKSAPPPPGSESGLISDFESEEITTQFGVGWSVSTDARMGGKSTAAFRRVKGGAQESEGSMLINGNLAQGNPYQWAGAFFSPGSSMMAPANLSSKMAISFWAKGDGKIYSIMFFTQSAGFIPVAQTFKTESEWIKYTFPFERFDTDGHDLMGIFIGGAPEKGEFTLLIDNVRLE